MAFETGSATGLSDLIAKLFTFAGLNGWTIDSAWALGAGAMHKNNIYISFLDVDPLLKIFTARGYTGGAPGTHTGSLDNSSTLTNSGKRVSHMAGPYPSYFFFEDDNYIHVVVENVATSFRHFGFGEMVKVGDWTGGEYAYAHHVSTGSQEYATSANENCYPFDAGRLSSVGSTQNFSFWGETNAAAALPGSKSAASRWGVTIGDSNTATDADGNALNNLLITGIDGGFTGPLYAVGASMHNGFLGLNPIHAMLWDRSVSPKALYLMGSVPDVRMCNVGALIDKQEYVIGADTWITFPAGRKGGYTGTEERCNHNGLAYKKIVT